MLEQLKHPYILPIVDVGIHNGFPYLVTEYAPNGSLYDRLQRQSPHPLSVEETITILSQVGQALQHAHQLNVVHRDLKPGNILFNAKGEALLADFGIATVLSTLSIQQATIVGTPAYMAPEQFKGTLSKESDEYALGCIAYELFTGHKPFTAPDIISMGFKHMTETPVAPRQLNPKVPVHIEQAILKAMAKERSNRYTSVSAFIIGLGGSPIGTTQKTTEQWLNEGNILYRAKRYDKALDAYEHAIQLDPNLADAYYYKGYTLTNLNRYQEALDAYERAIQLAPNDAVAYNGKGYVLYNLNRYQEALEAYDHAIQPDSNYAYAYIGKGNALSYLKRYDEALATYDRAIQLDPNYAYAYIGKGNALRNLKRYDEALVAYEHAIQLDPNNANYKKSYRKRWPHMTAASSLIPTLQLSTTKRASNSITSNVTKKPWLPMSALSDSIPTTPMLTITKATPSITSNATKKPWLPTSMLSDSIPTMLTPITAKPTLCAISSDTKKP